MLAVVTNTKGCEWCEHKSKHRYLSRSSLKSSIPRVPRHVQIWQCGRDDRSTRRCTIACSEAGNPRSCVCTRRYRSPSGAHAGTSRSSSLASCGTLGGLQAFLAWSKADEPCRDGALCHSKWRRGFIHKHCQGASLTCNQPCIVMHPDVVRSACVCNTFTE